MAIGDPRCTSACVDDFSGFWHQAGMSASPNPASAWHWVESAHWDLKFHGLPGRIPWRNNQPPPPTGLEPGSVATAFPMEELYHAVELMVEEVPEVPHGDAFRGFLRSMELGVDFISAMQRSDFIAAEGVLREMERVAPETAYRLFNKAFVLLRTDRAEEACACYERALELQPDSEMVWMRYGEVCRQLGKREKAVRAFFEARRVLPNHQQATRALEEMGELFCVTQPGKPNEPEWLTKEQIRALSEQNLQAVWSDAAKLRAFGASQLSDRLFPDLALRALMRAVEMEPAHAEGWRNLGVALRLNGKARESLEALERAERLEPANAWTHFHMAETYVTEQDMRLAWIRLQVAVKLDRNHKAALELLFLRRGDRTPEQQEDDIAEFSRPQGGEGTGSWQGFLLAAHAAWSRGARERAVKFAAEAYKIAPNHDEVFLTYTGMLGESGENEWVAALTKPRLKANEKNPRAWSNFARALDALGLRDEAIRTLRQGLEELSLDAAARAHFETRLDHWTERFAESEAELELHQGGESIRRNIYLIDGDRRGPCLFENGMGFPFHRKVPVNFQNPRTEFFFTFEQQNIQGDPESHLLGTFLVSEVDPDRLGTEAVTMFLKLTERKRLSVAATQGQRKLRVQWSLYPPPRHEPEAPGLKP